MTAQLDLFGAGDELVCSCGKAARPQTCVPCRAGQHGDHHDGIWDHAHHDDPTYCPCERCGGPDAARRFAAAMRARRA